jgi:hypothetical protein
MLICVYKMPVLWVCISTLIIRLSDIERKWAEESIIFYSKRYDVADRRVCIHLKSTCNTFFVICCLCTKVYYKKY